MKGLYMMLPQNEYKKELFAIRATIDLMLNRIFDKFIE